MSGFVLVTSSPIVSAVASRLTTLGSHVSLRLPLDHGNDYYSGRGGAVTFVSHLVVSHRALRSFVSASASFPVHFQRPWLQLSSHLQGLLLHSRLACSSLVFLCPLLCTTSFQCLRSMGAIAMIVAYSHPWSRIPCIVSFSRFPRSSAASGLVVLHLIDSLHLLASHELAAYPSHSRISWTHCIFFTFPSCLHSLSSCSRGFLLHLSSLSCQALDPMLSHWCVSVFSVPVFR